MNRIKELRINAGLTQKEIATALGCNQSAIGKYEREDLEPNITALKTLADLFNCSIDYLLGREDEFGIIQAKNELTQAESQLLTLFKTLNERDQNKVLGYVQALAY